MIYPTVSCICATRNRAHFLRQAVRYFQRQVYPMGRLEFVIVDNSAHARNEWVGNPNVIYHHVEPRPDAGPARYFNLANEIARGEIRVHWDDDDFYSKRRVFDAVHALDRASVVAAGRYYVLDATTGRAAKGHSWHAEGPAGLGGSLAYWKEVWQDTRLRGAEPGYDNRFLEDLQRKGVEVVNTLEPQNFLHVRHRSNMSVKAVSGWSDEDTRAARAVLGDDAAFYDELGELFAVSPLASAPAPAWVRPHNAWQR